MVRGAPRLDVVRTGAGPTRAAATAGSLAGSRRPSAVAVAGVAGGLRPGLLPGTIVVADRVLAEDGTVVAVLESAGIIAAELRDRGAPVTIGSIISTSKLVEGAGRRADLAATGALAVDCETACLLGAPWGVPAAVVRVIADTPERELRSLATITGGVKALKGLSAAAPVLYGWGRTIATRRVLLAGPRSFCAGVERAVTTVERALERYGRPLYVRRQIVHNRHVVEDLEQRGAVFVQELDEVPPGSTVVLSAHGVAPSVRREADARDLTLVDATCPLVAKVHREVRRFADRGYQMVLIGHAGHDETEGTLGESDDISLVTTADDIDRLEIRDPEKVAYITQTTLSPADVAGIVSRLSERYPKVVGPHATDICYATQNRQDAVAAIAEDCDLMLVVGSSNSSNAARLVEVSERAGCRAVLIEDETELRFEWLRFAGTVGVTAAASTPPHLVERVVMALRGVGAVSVETRTTRTENVNFPLPMEVR